MLLKMWGLGLWRNEHSYFIDNWCRFDFFIVMASWVDFMLTILPLAPGLYLKLAPWNADGIQVSCFLQYHLRFNYDATKYDIILSLPHA